MDHQLICTWLGLPTRAWPPDHYTLLGLPPGETDCARIEQRVHERLARLRCYQISHPGPATDAMNRLAQAFVCLTDREAKRAYDAQFFPQLAAPAAPPAAAVQPQAEPPVQAVATLPPPAPPIIVSPNADTAVGHGGQTQLDWKDATPPPVRGLVLPAPAGTPAQSLAPVEVVPPLNGEAAAPVNGVLPASIPAPLPAAKPVDPLAEAARSAEARRGLRTRRDHYERVLTTRRLLRAWDRAGKYLARPRRKLTKPAEENELARLLERIDELLLTFPELLGQPGQPGYRVLALTHDDAPAAMFKGLDAGQRDALVRDWLAGKALLRAHRQFLRQRLKAMRRRGPVARLLYAIRALVNDHPGWVATALLLVIATVLALLLR